MSRWYHDTKMPTQVTDGYANSFCCIDPLHAEVATKLLNEYEDLLNVADAAVEGEFVVIEENRHPVGCVCDECFNEEMGDSSF